MEISTDGRHLAITIVNDVGLYDIWVADMKQRRLSRFVQEPRRDCQPQYWTPDGESLIYQCATNEKGWLHLRRIDGSDDARELISWSWPESYWAHAFLPDGTLILNHGHDGDTDLVLMSLGTDGDAPPAPTTWLANAWIPEVSPDGRWIAFESDASGRREVYLRSLGKDNVLGREVPITKNSGGGAWWYPDRTNPLRLRYWRQSKAWAVEIATAGGLDVSEPVLLRDDSPELRQKLLMGDVLPDGRWLVVMKDENEALPDRVNVVLNWSEELKRRLEATP